MRAPDVADTAVMSDELTDAELGAMADRAEASLPGPWEALVGGGLGGPEFIRTGGLDDIAPDLYVTLSSWDDQPPKIAPAPVLQFIAAARPDVPRLVAEIRRLRS